MRTRMQAIALAAVFFLGTSVPLAAEAQSVIPGPCEPAQAEILGACAIAVAQP